MGVIICKETEEGHDARSFGYWDTETKRMSGWVRERKSEREFGHLGGRGINMGERDRDTERWREGWRERRDRDTERQSEREFGHLGGRGNNLGERMKAICCQRNGLKLDVCVAVHWKIYELAFSTFNLFFSLVGNGKEWTYGGGGGVYFA